MRKRGAAPELPAGAEDEDLNVCEGGAMEAVGEMPHGSGDAARPLTRSAAALLDVLSLAEVQRSLERPEGEAVAAGKDIASLGIALGRPDHPEVRQLLLSLWETLEGAAPAGAALPEIGGLPRTLHDFDLGSCKLPDLKALCRALELPVGGKKADVQGRLRDLVPQLPQRVPLAAVLAVQPRIGRTVRARESLAALPEAEDHELTKADLIGHTAAKHDFCISDADLARQCLKVSYGGAKARWYRLRDVKKAALLRYGSQAALEEAQARSRARAEAMERMHSELIVVRKAEVDAELAAQGLTQYLNRNYYNAFVYPRHQFVTLETVVASARSNQKRERRRVEQEEESARREAARQVERGQREAELLAGLEARGLEPRLSGGCTDFIYFGGEVEEVINRVEEQRFFDNLTTYQTDFDEIKVATSIYEGEEGKHDPNIAWEWDWAPDHRPSVGTLPLEELSRRARERTLLRWLNKHASLETCLAAPELPPSLHAAAREGWPRRGEPEEQDRVRKQEAARQEEKWKLERQQRELERQQGGAGPSGGGYVHTDEDYDEYLRDIGAIW